MVSQVWSNSILCEHMHMLCISFVYTCCLQVVNLGPVYAAGLGESLAAVAARFQTTVRTLLSLNPDVSPAAALALPEGQELCLVLCSL